MSIRLTEESDGKVLIIKVRGKLVKADYEHFVPELERLIEQHGALRLLFDMTDFHGWGGRQAHPALRRHRAIGDGR